MAKVFFISDTHFKHTNILTFEPYYRPFKSIQEHDAALVEKWNSVVNKGDIVFHLGDVAMGSHGLETVSQLNGDKRLIMGNHDKAPTSNYLKHFTKIYGSITYKDFICTHIPVSDKQFGRFKGNIHGHLHSKVMEDLKYFNVSVEQIKLTPILFEDLLFLWESKNARV